MDLAGWRCRPRTRRWPQVELALQARFSTNEGALVVQAQLTQNSWLLTPDCRLTGGFAYASFFGANPNAGQMVLSVGGYHPDFHHDGYPVVPRVGYVWSVASVLTISGQSYFALTSEAIMAGTQFTASLDLGFLWASLTLGIDAIVYFDPFSFDATGYAAIAAGVTISIDLGWFGTIEVNLSFHLGARSTCTGRTSAGRPPSTWTSRRRRSRSAAAPTTARTQLSWADFSAKYLTAGGASVLSAMPQAGQLTGTVTTSAGTTPTGDADKPWKFVAEWSLSVATTAAATALQLPSSVLPYGLSEVPGIASMAIDALTSTLAVTIAGSAGGDVAPPILGPADPGEGLRVALVTAPLPKGVWTANPNDGSVPSGDTITAGTGFVLQAEATVEGATPEIPLNQIEPTKGRKPLPFAQETAARPHPAGRRRQRRRVRRREPSRAAGSGQPVQVALGYLTSGPLSEPLTPMATLAFGRDRVAPPRPALLTEGMVSPQTPPPATTPVVTPPPPVIDTSIHPPVIAGVLGGLPGAGAAPGPAHLRRRSVAAATRTALAAAATPALPAAAAPAISRVAAPTLASVAALTDPAFAAALSRLAPAALAADTGLRAADGGPVSLRAATPAELRPGPAATAAQATLLSANTAALLAKGTVLRPGDADRRRAAERGARPRRQQAAAHGDGDGRRRRPRGRAERRGPGARRRHRHAARGDADPAAHGPGRAVVRGRRRHPPGRAGRAGRTSAACRRLGARTLLGADAVVNGVPAPGAAPRGEQCHRAGRHGGRGRWLRHHPAACRHAGHRRERRPGGRRPRPDRPHARPGRRVPADRPGRRRAAARPWSPRGRGCTWCTRVVPPAVPAAASAAPSAVEVTVGTSASWRLTGVLGGPADAATTAARIAAQGAAAAAAPLLRAPTGSAMVSWHVPPEVS